MFKIFYRNLTLKERRFLSRLHVYEISLFFNVPILYFLPENIIYIIMKIHNKFFMIFEQFSKNAASEYLIMACLSNFAYYLFYTYEFIVK